MEVAGAFGPGPMPMRKDNNLIFMVLILLMFFPDLLGGLGLGRILENPMVLILIFMFLFGGFGGMGGMGGPMC